MKNNKQKWDFGGWATRNDLKCADGRTIRKDAFKENDGVVVPLMWQHQHDDPAHVLGHALLENRDEGVYTYGKFNDTEEGIRAKKLVANGDITTLSIYANQLKQHGGDVLHGCIREVSLVLAGANPGARIDMPMELAHSDEEVDEAYIYTGKRITFMKDKNTLNHSEEEMEDEETAQDIFDSLTEKQKDLFAYMMQQAANGQNESEDDEDEDDEEDSEDYDDEEQDEDEEYEDPEEDEEMKHNVFENDNKENALSHADMKAIIDDARKYGSLKDSVLAHGIETIDILFPDAQAISDVPDWIKREDAWVKAVMNGTHHTPFSRIKSIHADITEDDARALGYLPDRTHRDDKGNLVDADGNPAYKKEEVFSLLKRTTTPATIYKKQKLDRDDTIDITDFDVVAWIKGEMRVMLDEEIARAILVGDGRSASSDDKINETNIRPIWKDDGLYTIKAVQTVTSTMTEGDIAKALIRAAVKSRKLYKGSGNPTFFTTEDVLTDMLLLEDKNGRVIYDTEEKLRSAMRVSKIVTVPVMEGLNYTDSSSKVHKLAGIIVNLADYNVGADKGGNVNMFDDFDIDYNAQKYLIETRCSGALIKPYSAIALETILDSASGATASLAFNTASTIRT